ncbi:MAG TPA: GldG family protein [Xenococcaceae cyanobacterium]
MTKFLLLLALGLFVTGLVVGAITDNWLILPTALILVGIIIGIGSLIIGKKESTKFWQTRATEAGINLLTKSVAILIILALINFLAIRYSVRFDLTENKLFTLAPQSQEIVANLTQPLKVWVFDRNIAPELKTLLENYGRYNDNFQFEFVDPEIQIGLAEQFNVQSFGEVYLEYGAKSQKLEPISNDLGANIAEIQLTNALVKIQSDRIFTIDFLQGHGEPELDAVEGGFSQAIAQLQDRGYVVRGLNLITQGKIPDDTDVIVIAKPLRNLLAQEVTLLQAYLDQGGRLMMMLMPDVDPGLTPILQNWGISLDRRFVIDFSGVGSTWGFGPGVIFVTNYGDHPITDSFGSGVTIFPESRPLNLTEKPEVTTTPLAITDENTWAESNLAPEEITFNPEEDAPGPLTLAFALNRESNSNLPATRMVVFGNGMFATDGWFQQQLNGDIFLNTVNWLIGEQNLPLSIRPQEATNRRINLSPTEAGLISWMALRIMPLLSFVLAGVIWWRKR